MRLVPVGEQDEDAAENVGGEGSEREYGKARAEMSVSGRGCAEHVLRFAPQTLVLYTLRREGVLR